MAKPVTAPVIFASSATFTGASGVPAGLVGQPVRVTGPTSFYQFGYEPNDTFKSQFVNAVVGPLTEWASWVNDGTSAADSTAHIVETVASGRANLRLLHIGASPVEPYFPAAMVEILAETGYAGLDILTVSSSLQALTISAASTGSPAVQIIQTGAGQNAMNITGVGGVGIKAINVNGGSGTGVSSTVTGATGSAIEGYATAGSVAGVFGSGSAAGVQGVTTATNGTGGRFDTAGSAISTSEAVDARAYGDGVGVRVAAADGNAINASCTGDQDVIAVLAAGTGAAIRMNPQAEPAVERIGQMWTELINADPNRAALLFDTNDSGLSILPSHVWLGRRPLLAAASSTNAVVPLAQGTLNNIVESITIENPYAFTVTVWVEGHFTALANPIGAIPLATAFTGNLYDSTAAVVLDQNAASIDVATHRTPYHIMESYAIPAGGNTTIELRVSITGGAGGSIDISHRKLRIMTAFGGVS